MNNKSKIFIAPICDEDVETLVENFCFPWDTPEKTREKWQKYYQEHQKNIRTVAVVKSQGEILGYGTLHFESEYANFSGIPEISDVWIGEKHRRMGLGGQLIDWFEVLAKEKGYQKIGIGVGLYADYGPAQKLYFKLGYTPDGYGVTYKYRSTVPGESYCLDDELILWLIKSL